MIKNKKGITLMQVVAAMVILGIIATIAGVTIFKQMDKAELAKGQLQADLIQDAVASYMTNNEGEMPLVIENDDYIEKPALIDLSKIRDNLNNEITGNFYIYGPSKTVYFDYPTDYIEKIYNEYDNKIEIIDENGYINTEKLYNEGLLEYEAITSYILISGEVVQVINENSKTKNQTGDNKPTKPIIIPSQAAPYYNTEEITFTAKSYSAKGEVRYEWEGIQSDNTYPVGELTISVTAYDIDGNASDTTTETYTIESVSSKNNAPSKPIISKSPDKPSYSSVEEIDLSANATDPDGDALEYIWIGKSHDDTYSRGNHEVSVYAVDEHGATSPKATVELKITNGPPTILNIKQVPDPAYLFDAVDIEVEAEDPDGDLISYDIKGLSDTRRYSYTHENNGKHEITVVATDSLGAESEPKKFTIKITNRPPTKPNLNMSPSPNSILRTNTDMSFTASSSQDPDNHNFHYEWKIDNGSWHKKSPDNRFTDRLWIGNHTVYVRAVDEFGEISPVNSVSFQVINTKPTRPEFSFGSTLDTITRLNPVITRNATDIDGHDITYYWRLDGGSWTTSRPTSRLISGNHTLELRTRDELGKYSDIYRRTFHIDEAQVTKTVTLGPTGSSSQTEYYTVPYGSRFRIDSDTITNSEGGSVSTRKYGDRIRISTSGGDWYSRDAYWDVDKYPKYINSYERQQYKSNSNLDYSYYYSQNGYVGYIYADGSADVISGHSYDTKRVSHTIKNSSYGNTSFPSSYYYVDGDYRGSIPRDGGYYRYSGYSQEGDTHWDFGTRSSNSCPSKSGYSLVTCNTFGSYTFVSGDNTWNLVKEFYGIGNGRAMEFSNAINSANDYKFTAYGWRTIPIGAKMSVPFTLLGERVTRGFSRYEWHGKYQKPDVDYRKYAQRYEGTITRPETRRWERKYSGTVYKPGTSYRNYKWKYVVRIKYTVY